MLGACCVRLTVLNWRSVSGLLHSEAASREAPPHLLTSPTLPPARQLTCRAHGHLVIAMGIPTNRARSDFDISSSALHNFNLNS